MKSIAGPFVALILAASFVNAAESSMLDKAMLTFARTTTVVDAKFCRAIHIHPYNREVKLSWDIMVDAELWATTQMDEVLVRHIMSKYNKTDVNSERLHWFMVMTAITHRGEELVDLMVSDQQPELSEELIGLFIETNIDLMYYIKDQDLKLKFNGMIIDRMNNE